MHVAAGSRRQALRVTWEHGGLTHVVEPQVQHAHPLQAWREDRALKSSGFYSTFTQGLYLSKICEYFLHPWYMLIILKTGLCSAEEVFGYFIEVKVAILLKKHLKSYIQSRTPVKVQMY